MMDKESRTRVQLVDLSHVITHGLVTYRGLPAPVICDFLSRVESRAHYDPGTEFHIGRIDMVTNTGTYIDTPFHRFADGVDLAAVALRKIADLDGIVAHARDLGSRAIGRSFFDRLDVQGKAVLVDTGWSEHWATDRYFEGHPFLTEDAAVWLRDRGAALVGIDSLNIDDTEDGRRPVHTALLGHGIPIVEHMTALDRLPDRGFRFYAVPPKIRALGSFPVRAFALVAEE
jgi:arylformamidase